MTANNILSLLILPQLLYILYRSSLYNGQAKECIVPLVGLERSIVCQEPQYTILALNTKQMLRNYIILLLH